MVRPNFFILGAPKCGTTALAQYLGGHPQVFLCDPKEPFYFDRDLHHPVHWTEESYLGLFRKADPARHRAVGEASTSYLFSPGAVDAILQFDPGAKLIAMLRNPMDLVQAFHAENVSWGIETILDLEEAWRAQADRREGRRIPSQCLEPRKLLLSEWGKLGFQLGRLLGKVGKDQVMLVLFDDFIGDTRRVYGQVLDFLGLPNDGRTEFPKVNPHKEVRFPFLQPWLRAATYQAIRAKEALGIPSLGLDLIRRMQLWNTRLTPKKHLSPAFLHELREHYREDVGKLSELLGRDLSGWLVEKEG